MASIVFKAPTPDLHLKCTGSREAGRCYYITTFEVRSIHKLSRAVFDGLREAGLLGYGQGFSVSEPKEEQELLVPVLKDSAGKVISEGYDVVVSPYSRQPYAPSYRTVYIYTITSECDSSD